MERPTFSEIRQIMDDYVNSISDIDGYYLSIVQEEDLDNETLL